MYHTVLLIVFVSVSDNSIDYIQSFLGETATQLENINPSVFTDCQYGQMRVLMSSGGRPFNGYIFAKNKFNTCGKVITNAIDSDLVLNFPSAYGPVPGGYESQDCGVIEIVCSLNFIYHILHGDCVTMVTYRLMCTYG